MVVRNNIMARVLAVGGQSEIARLVVDSVYIVAVRLEDAEGGPLRTGSFSDIQPVFTADGLTTFSSRFARQLAGIRVPSEFGESRPDRFIWFFTGGRGERVGPFRLQIHALGYEPAAADVWSHRISNDGKISIQSIRLHAVRDIHFGDASIAIRGQHTTELGADVPPQSLGVMRLVPDGWELPYARSIGRWVKLPLREPVSFRGIPEGRYRIDLTNSPLRLDRHAPGNTVLVSRDRVAHGVLRVPAGWGGVEVRPTLRVDGKSVAYRGPLVINLRYGRGHRFSVGANVSRAPYRLPAVTPGDYPVVAVIDAATYGEASVLVESGKWGVVGVEIRKHH